MVETAKGDVPLLVAKVDGILTAIESTCTHMGCNVATGKVLGRVVVCPCHGSRYDLITGEVKGGPAIEPLRKYDVRIVGNEIFVD